MGGLLIIQLCHLSSDGSLSKMSEHSYPQPPKRGRNDLPISDLTRESPRARGLGLRRSARMDGSPLGKGVGKFRIVLRSLLLLLLILLLLVLLAGLHTLTAAKEEGTKR